MADDLINTFNSLGLATAETPKPKKNDSLGQEEFLKLMTTQLTHQNPMEPMENGDFLSQMAQFGTVSGIQDLQESFKDFASSISSDQALQAASLVGRQVSAVTDQGLLSAGGEIKGAFELPGSSPNTSVKIIDPLTGEVVRNMDLGGHAKGRIPFTWDGLTDGGELANPGVYKIQVEAQLDGNNTVLQTEINSQVESVSMGNGKQGLQINLLGTGKVKFSDIKQIS
jgi:flagellar basal-body rod modification protein FlgD